MTKYSYVVKFKRKDETVFTKRFLASDLFEADEHALEYRLLKARALVASLLKELNPK